MAAATSVRLSEETGRKLDELAARTGRSKSFYLRQAVEQHIDRLTYEYDILDRVEQIRRGDRTYTRTELEQAVDDLDD